jgi:hypothetical protein
MSNQNPPFEPLPDTLLAATAVAAVASSSSSSSSSSSRSPRARSKTTRGLAGVGVGSTRITKEEEVFDDAPDVAAAAALYECRRDSCSTTFSQDILTAAESITNPLQRRPEDPTIKYCCCPSSPTENKESGLCRTRIEHQRDPTVYSSDRRFVYECQQENYSSGTETQRHSMTYEILYTIPIAEHEDGQGCTHLPTTIATRARAAAAATTVTPTTSACNFRGDVCTCGDNNDCLCAEELCRCKAFQMSHNQGRRPVLLPPTTTTTTTTTNDNDQHAVCGIIVLLLSWPQQERIVAPCFSYSIHMVQGAQFQSMLSVTRLNAIAVMQPAANATSTLQLVLKAQGSAQYSIPHLVPL